MFNLGLGVMIKMLGGNEESVKAFSSCVGKQIGELFIDENALHFVFSDGSKMKLFDDGQSCCESRYMTCSDDLNSYIGSNLLSAEIAGAPNVADELGEHEVQFLRIQTSAGAIVCETHNEHNGYYGGFWVVSAMEE